MPCSITDEYQRRGGETVFLENDHLRVEVLVGKGGDVTQIVDKRTDTNVLFESPHEWRLPDVGAFGAPDGRFTFLDYYPGGWQDVLPGAGGPAEAHGASLALHGESSIVPWESRITEASSARVALELRVSLTRYPFDIRRTLSLRRDEPTLVVDERVQNRGAVPVQYSWLQHIALGEPLISPRATIDVPCETVHVDPDQTNETARLPPGETFEWPTYETETETIDLRSPPPREERVHDLVALGDLREGRYTVSNPNLDLGVTVTFPESIFEFLWYWQPFGGFETAPFFGRNYNVGLEPCTSIPGSGLESAIENGTARTLDPAESERVEIEFRTTSVS